MLYPRQKITRRQRLAGAGADRPQLLRAVLDTIPTPVFYKDPEGRLLGCNLAFAASVQQTRDELLGQTVYDFLSPEEAVDAECKDRALMASGGSQVYPVIVERKDGGAWKVVVHKATFQNADGSLGGIVASLIDVTEKQGAQEALRRSEELLSIISRHVMDLLSIIDERGQRLYTSPSYIRVLGYRPEALAALAPLGLLHPEDLERVRTTLAALFRGEFSASFEYRLRHQDGRYFTFEAKGALVAGALGQAPRALMVARDITERKVAEGIRTAMEVQLRQAQKLEAIGSLAAGIAHEINTPTQYIGDNATFLKEALGSVMGFLSAQRRFLEDHRQLEGLGDDAEAALRQFRDLDLDYLAVEVPRAIQQTLEGVGRVTSIVSAMKDFSHPGGDERLPTDLNRSILNTLTVSRNAWKYVAELETDLDPALVAVPCYQGELNQALLNLVVNAAHAIEEAALRAPGQRRGLIRICTRKLGEEVLVSVADNGTGISPALRERIFEPFFTTKPVGKGTGQGLAIVHAVVVDKHGGRVTVDSEPGAGSTFTLYLPLQAKATTERSLQ